MILRLNFQITAHKQPTVAAECREKQLVTAENGLIKLWSLYPEQLMSGGPVPLRRARCPRQKLEALFITPRASQVIGVFADAGVILFDMTASTTEQHVLIRLTDG